MFQNVNILLCRCLRHTQDIQHISEPRILIVVLGTDKYPPQARLVRTSKLNGFAGELLNFIGNATNVTKELFIIDFLLRKPEITDTMEKTRPAVTMTQKCKGKSFSLSQAQVWLLLGGLIGGWRPSDPTNCLQIAIFRKSALRSWHFGWQWGSYFGFWAQTKIPESNLRTLSHLSGLGTSRASIINGSSTWSANKATQFQLLLSHVLCKNQGRLSLIVLAEGTPHSAAQNLRGRYRYLRIGIQQAD